MNPQFGYRFQVAGVTNAPYIERLETHSGHNSLTDSQSFLIVATSKHHVLTQGMCHVLYAKCIEDLVHSLQGEVKKQYKKYKCNYCIM